MRLKKLSIAIQVGVVTSIIGLALSYFTTLIHIIPDISFLEAIGVYALWMPFHNVMTSNSSE